MTAGIGWLILMPAVIAAQTQIPDQIRRAQIGGSGGASGKCRIEVRVETSAEVDVYGDSGRLRTIAGQPATWTRMDCTAPLPYKMSDFRFRGIDGRGNVRLLQDPRNNNSVAVIRIDDPKSGSEGYTFEIQWSGASGGAPSDGFAAGAGAAATTGTGPAGPNPAPAGGISAERAIDLCRTELHARAERDYGLRNIEITSAAVDTGQGMRDWITGAFNDRSGVARRSPGYRFRCAVDYGTGQVRALEITRAGGGAVQPLSAAAAMDLRAARVLNLELNR